MRVLVIDNTIDSDSWGSPQLCRALIGNQHSSGVTTFVRRAPQGDLPRDLRGYDRIVLSGSRTSAMEDAPWIAALHDLIRSAIDLGKPMLGVCYGHQSIARVLGDKTCVRKARAGEVGWTRIQVIRPSALTDGVGESFHSFSLHLDEVSQLPPQTTCLAQSAGCAIQAYQLNERPVFGVQFHPERNLDEGNRTLHALRKETAPEALVNPNSGSSLYDSKVGEIIFGNFLKL